MSVKEGPSKNDGGGAWVSDTFQGGTVLPQNSTLHNYTPGGVCLTSGGWVSGVWYLKGELCYLAFVDSEFYSL